MGNIPGISAVTNAASAIGNLILVTPQSTIGYQPQNKVGQPANQPSILFNYEAENTGTLESDITDHYVEDNTAVQDQIALRPVIITTQGFVGELNDIPPNSAFALAYKAAQKLTSISAYTPALSTTALLAYNEAVFAYESALSLANAGISAWQTITGISGGESVVINGNLQIAPNQTQQQQYFQQFYGYWVNRILFTIQTPWAIFEDMAIKSLKAIQSAETRVITNFEVSFKQIKYASVLTEAVLYTDNSNFQSRLINQGASATNLGTSALTESPVSFDTGLGQLQ